jgi:glyoxylase-like metal-dependent hydrolase (beta-lactamase superfamily II)/rhodanese-related sulfurtransferase
VGTSISQLDIDTFVTEGLGDTTYLLAVGDEALLVDPQRDVDRFLAAVQARDLRLTTVLETHVHNDYVSGARELAKRSGAEIAGPARGGYRFAHRGLSEGDEVRIAELRLVAVATPGHTPEHLAYLVYGPDPDQPLAVFTGGSLLVGSAGRTDLLGPERTEELTRAQFATLRRLADLPDAVQVLPTHGGGSFCIASKGGTERTSTMGQERMGNEALRETSEEAFLRSHTSGLFAFPDYYRHMAPLNRAGPRILGGIPVPPALSADRVAERKEKGVWVVDGRGRDSFAGAHIAGSLNIELNEQFASYVGWLVPFGDPIVLVLDRDRNAAEAARHLMRIGYEEQVLGYLSGGTDAWEEAGLPHRTYAVGDVEDLCRDLAGPDPPLVLDVRQEREHRSAALPDSLHVFVADLPERLVEVPRDRRVWAACASGHRSAMAASMLDGAGVPVTLLARGGIRDVLKRCAPGSLNRPR